jgi:predicted TIM-barrel fold metal-dependent hydrolase
MKDQLYLELLNEITSVPVIDTHEHLCAVEPAHDPQKDILQEYLSHYMSSDLISSGLPIADLNKIRGSGVSVKEKWDIVEPYWERCRFTGYGRALDLSVNKLYGADRIDGTTIESLNQKFKSRNKPGRYRHVLKDICGIEMCVLDAWDGRFECDRTLFRRVWQILSYIIPMPEQIPEGGMDTVTWLEDKYNLRIKSLDDWIEAFRLELDDNLDHGIIGVKNILAYFRSLRFEQVEYGTAKKRFTSDLNKWEKARGRNRINVRFSKVVQDFMMHYILGVLNEKELFIQIHTGILEGSFQDIRRTNPSLLSNLFARYPAVRFDLFHIGYPYQAETSALAKIHPNVFIDMCWSHIISPKAARSALDEFLDAVPYNKISAFGGDYIFPDAIYGHLTIARENTAKVLSGKIKKGILSIQDAAGIAEHLFNKNPRKILNLQ